MPAVKTILFDKYNPYIAKQVTKTKLNIKEYKVSITYNYNIMKFYVLYEKKWIILRNIIQKLRAE